MHERARGPVGTSTHHATPRTRWALLALSVLVVAVVIGAGAAPALGSLALVERFDHTPTLASVQTAGAWYTDRYAPAGFTKATFDGDKRLKLSISSADSIANRPPAYNSTFYNTQGRKYDLSPRASTVSADLYVAPDWATNSRRSDMWVTAVDAAGGITGYPIIGFVNGVGFRCWDNLGWHNVGFPDGFSYGRWYNLRIMLNPTSVTYYIDGGLVYTSDFADDTDMATCTGFDNVMLQAYNFGDSYDVYWDNASPVPPATGFTISTTAGANGAISPASPTVDLGEDCTVAITPNAGYYIASLTVDGAAVPPAASHTFSNVSANHSVAATFAAYATSNVYNLEPSWAAPGGGGVFSAYIGPLAYDYVSPGATAHFSGRTAGIIKAGLAIDPTDGVYEDQGLFAFKPGDIPVETFAGLPLTYDFVNQYGAHPVWVYMELDKGLPGDVIYQYVPATNPASWHTEDAGTGAHWQAWTDTFSGITTGPMMSLTDIAAANPGKTVSRVYLSLGMGDAYHDNANGTVAWVSNAKVGTTSYDFVVTTYTITPTAGLNGTIAPGTTTVDIHGDATFTISPNTGYHIAAVTVDSAPAAATSPVAFHDVTGNHTLGATFAINTYTLTYSAGSGGAVVGTSPQTVNHGSDGATVTATPTTGYHFTGWSDGVGTAARCDRVVTHDVSVTANFAINTYTLTYSAGSGGTVVGTSPQTVNHGSDGATVTATPNTGYHFASWSDGVLTAARRDRSVTGNITVTANFTINSYTLASSAGAGGTISATQTVTYGSDSASFTITPNAGYHIATVTVDGGSVGAVGSYKFIAVGADHAIAATFAINTYTIVPTSGANGSISPATTQTVNYGATPAFTMTPANGYNVATVTVDGVSVGAPAAYTFAAIAANHSISVTFLDKTAPLTFSDASAVYLNSGTIHLSASDGGLGVAHVYYKLDSGSQVESSTVVVAAYGSHTLEFWSVDVAGNVEAHKTAFFSISDTVAPGTTSDAVSAYTGSATIRLTPTDNANGSGVAHTYYRLDGGDQTEGRICSTSAAGSHTLEFWSTDNDGNAESPHKTATFTVNAIVVNFTVTSSAGSNGSIAPLGAQTVASGSDSPTFTITASTGYHIADVLVDGASVGAVGTYKFANVTADHSIAASFAVNAPSVTSTYTITASGNAGGIVAPLSQAVTAGSNASVTFTPNSGFYVSSVLVDGSAVAPVSPIAFTNVQSAHTVAVTFAAVRATTITIRSSASSVRLPKPFVLDGMLTPGALHDFVVCEVQKPRTSRWSYSSNRLCYEAVATAGHWWYRYTPLLRGTYTFRAHFLGDATRLGSYSGTLAVTVK